MMMGAADPLLIDPLSKLNLNLKQTLLNSLFAIFLEVLPYVERDHYTYNDVL